MLPGRDTSVVSRSTKRPRSLIAFPLAIRADAHFWFCTKSAVGTISAPLPSKIRQTMSRWRTTRARCVADSNKLRERCTAIAAYP